MKKVTLELTDEQFRVLTQALDAYSRLGIGQLRYACENFTTSPVSNSDDLAEAEQLLLKFLYPVQHPPFAPFQYPGISNVLCPEDSKVSRDLHHTIQHEWRKNKEQRWSVYSSDDLQFSQQPRAKVRFEE